MDPVKKTDTQWSAGFITTQSSDGFYPLITVGPVKGTQHTHTTTASLEEGGPEGHAMHCHFLRARLTYAPYHTNGTPLWSYRPIPYHTNSMSLAHCALCPIILTPCPYGPMALPYHTNSTPLRPYDPMLYHTISMLLCSYHPFPYRTNSMPL